MRAPVLQALLTASASAQIRPRHANVTSTRPSRSGVNNTGIEYASSCVASKYAWLAAHGQTVASSETIRTTRCWTAYSFSTSYETITSATNSTPYTLCDGWPRINGSTSIRTSTTRFEIPRSTLDTVETTVLAPAPAPTCTIQADDCDALYAAYSSDQSAFNSSAREWISIKASESAVSTTGTSHFTYPHATVSSPICGSLTLGPSPHLTMMVDSGVCQANSATIQLLYWPVTRIGGDCENNKSTMTMGPTISGQPNTFVFWNTTLTSPTVYMALDGTWLITSAGSTIANQSRLIIPQSSTAVSSYCGKLGGGFGQPMPVNYADLNEPIAASAYRCQPRCFKNEYRPYASNITYTLGAKTSFNTIYPATTKTVQVETYHEWAAENLCSTIWGDDFRPVLSIPPEFSSMAPAGQGFGISSCPFKFDAAAVFYDPPFALTAANSVKGPGNGPTSALGSAATASITAAPASKVQHGMPTATAEPVLLPSSSSSPTEAELEWIATTHSPHLESSETLLMMPKPTNPPVQPVNSQALNPTPSVDEQDAPTVPAASLLQNSGPVLVIGSEALDIDYNPDSTFASGEALTPGEIVTIAATTISLAISASALVVDGVTRISPAAGAAGPVITLGEMTYTADSGGVFDLELKTTLTPGDAVTIAGSIISLAATGNAVVVNGITESIVYSRPAAATAVGTRSGRTGTAVSTTDITGITSTFIAGASTVTTSGAGHIHKPDYVVAAVLLGNLGWFCVR